MDNKKEKRKILEIIIKLIIFIAIGFWGCIFIIMFSGIVSLILNEKLIEFLLTASITGAGFGIVGLQMEETDKYKREIKEELIDVSIWMIICFFSTICFKAFPNAMISGFNFGHLGIFCFVCGITLFFMTLIFVRLKAYNFLVDLYKK